jgi:hypothetical protein
MSETEYPLEAVYLSACVLNVKISEQSIAHRIDGLNSNLIS